MMAEANVVAEHQHAGDRFSLLLEAVRKRVNKQQYATWFQRTTLVRWSENALVIGVPNRFYEEWFHKHFRELITNAAEEIGQAPTELSF